MAPVQSSRWVPVLWTKTSKFFMFLLRYKNIYNKFKNLIQGSKFKFSFRRLPVQYVLSKKSYYIVKKTTTKFSETLVYRLCFAQSSILPHTKYTCNNLILIKRFILLNIRIFNFTYVILSQDDLSTCLLYFQCNMCILDFRPIKKNIIMTL